MFYDISFSGVLEDIERVDGNDFALKIRTTDGREINPPVNCVNGNMGLLRKSWIDDVIGETVEGRVLMYDWIDGDGTRFRNQEYLIVRSGKHIDKEHRYNI